MLTRFPALSQTLFRARVVPVAPISTMDSPTEAGVPGAAVKRETLTCDECSRPVMTLDPDNEVVRIESRHGGHRHVTVLGFREIIDRLTPPSIKYS